MAVSSGSLVFFGTDAFSIPSFEALLDAGYTIEAVITKPDGRVGRGRELAAPRIKELALERDVRVIQPASATDLKEAVLDLKSTRGVVVAYGRIIPPVVLDHFSDGIVNVHPSLLPKYRGPAPIEAAIINGDSETGVTLMQLDRGMDTGPIFVRENVPLTGSEDKPGLYNRLAAYGAAMLTRNLEAIIYGTLAPTPQYAFTSETTSVTSLITKADGVIDWIKPAEVLERHVRAYLSWPGTKAMIDGIDVTITAAHPGDSVPLVGTGETGGQPGTAFKTSHGELAIVTGHGELIIERLKPAGKTEMTGQAFLAGHPLS